MPVSILCGLIGYCALTGCGCTCVARTLNCRVPYLGSREAITARQILNAEKVPRYLLNTWTLHIPVTCCNGLILGDEPRNDLHVATRNNEQDWETKMESLSSNPALVLQCKTANLFGATIKSLWRLSKAGKNGLMSSVGIPE